MPPSNLIAQIDALQGKLTDNLIDTIEFWLKYSIDQECGGYFNCIGKDGKIYDTTKYVWLQCRAVWMFCRLHTNPILQHSKCKSLKRRIYTAAKHGMAFISKKVIFKDKETDLYRCYFSVDRNGNGLSIQRKIFSECFFVMALISYAAMIYNIYSKLNNFFDNALVSEYINEADECLKLALNVFKDIQAYIQKPSLLGFKYKPDHIPNDRQFEPLNIPMICLNIIYEFKSLIPPKHIIYQANIGTLYPIY